MATLYKVTGNRAIKIYGDGDLFLKYYSHKTICTIYKGSEYKAET